MNRIELTAEQLSICDCEADRLIVEANAGAAKTTTLAFKIRQLVAQGVDPHKVLALSFSPAGVKAFLGAFRRAGLPEPVVQAIRTQTFDRFCAARLKHLEGAAAQPLATPEQARPHVLEAIRQARMWADERYPGEFTITDSGELAVEELLRQFEHIKGTLQLQREADTFTLSPSGAHELGRDFTTLAVLRFHEALRHPVQDGDNRASFRYGSDATYDLARELMSESPRFDGDDHPLRLDLQAIVVDEMHDMNWAMFTVLRALLAVNEHALFVGVGDRDQVIHHQHGADHDFMGAGFERELGAVARLPLTTTFRFDQTLARPLGAFARKAYAAASVVSSRVDVRPCDSAQDLRGLIHTRLANRPGPDQSSPGSQLAVLLRHPAHAADLEHELRKAGLRYEAVGFTTYLLRPEILFARMILMTAVELPEKFASGVLLQAKRATWAFMGGTLQRAGDTEDPTPARIESAPQDNFTRWLIPGLLETADPRIAENIQHAMALASSDETAVLPEALRVLGIEGLARRLLVTQQAIDDAGASVQALARAGAPYGSISSFLKSLLTFDYEMASSRHAQDRLVLSSIEAAKGLEFDDVIVPHVDARDFDGPGMDERNLFYVAASRAKRQLTLTHGRRGPSTYLAGFMGREH